MHVLISWDIHATAQDWNTINNELIGVLPEGKYTKVLSTMYIVEADTDARSDLLHRMTEVAKQSNNVEFIVSPAISYAHYEGLLKRDLWGEINTRTKQNKRPLSFLNTMDSPNV